MTSREQEKRDKEFAENLGKQISQMQKFLYAEMVVGAYLVVMLEMDKGINKFNKNNGGKNDIV